MKVGSSEITRVTLTLGILNGKVDSTTLRIMQSNHVHLKMKIYLNITTLLPYCLNLNAVTSMIISILVVELSIQLGYTNGHRHRNIDPQYKN